MDDQTCATIVIKAADSSAHYLASAGVGPLPDPEKPIVGFFSVAPMDNLPN